MDRHRRTAQQRSEDRIRNLSGTQTHFRRSFQIGPFRRENPAPDTEISLSIDNRKHLPEIAAALSRYADVTVEDDMVVVCVVGDLKWYNVGFEHRIVDSLKDIPVRMISYGDNCDISFVLRRNDKKKALEALNCCVSL